MGFRLLVRLKKKNYRHQTGILYIVMHIFHYFIAQRINQLIGKINSRLITNDSKHYCTLCIQTNNNTGLFLFTAFSWSCY